MNVMRLVVEHHQLVDVLHNHAQVYARIGRRSRWTFAKEIIHRIVVIGRGRDVVAGAHAVDIRQKDIAGRLGNAHLVLLV